MSSLAALALLVGGLVLVVAGAEAFFDGVLASAERLRVSPFVVTVLLSGMELENLGAGIAANAKGLPGAAAGTFLGGTTFLALGVAGVGAAIAPIRSGLPRAGLVWTAAAPAALVVLSVDGELSRLDGALLLVWFAVALTGLIRSGRSVMGEPPRRARFPLIRVLAGLGLLTLGGELLGEGIRRAVSRFGISQTLLGNTAVAASVEAEEVARVVVPARRGSGDVALGNVLATIVHFTGFNAGVIALVRPLPLDADSLHLHLPVAAAAPALLCSLVWVRRGLGKAEGAALAALYAAYLAAAIAVGVG